MNGSALIVAGLEGSGAALVAQAIRRCLFAIGSTQTEASGRTRSTAFRALLPASRATPQVRGRATDRASIRCEPIELSYEDFAFPQVDPNAGRRLLVVRHPISWVLAAGGGGAGVHDVERWIIAHEESLSSTGGRRDVDKLIRIEEFAASPRNVLSELWTSLGLCGRDVAATFGGVSEQERQKYRSTSSHSTVVKELAKKSLRFKERILRLGYSLYEMPSVPFDRSIVPRHRRPPPLVESTLADKSHALTSRTDVQLASPSVTASTTGPVIPTDVPVELLEEEAADIGQVGLKPISASVAPVESPKRGGFVPGVRPLRVGFVTPSLGLGGAERWMIALTRHSEPGSISWTGTALSPWGGGDPTIVREMRELMPIYSSAPRGGGAILEGDELVTRLASFREAVAAVADTADIVITWGAMQDAALVTNPDCKVVFVSHCSFQSPSTSHSHALGRAHLVAVSAAASEVFSDSLKRRVTVIHNGIEVERCRTTVSRAKMRARWGIDERHRLIGYVGRPSHEKNPLAAAHAVKELGDDCRAVYIGAGRQQDEIKRAAMEIAGDRVLFVPPLEPIGDALSALDVFLLASPSEGFSLALAEAWFVGVPTVATRVGAVPELEERFGQLVVPVSSAPTPVELGAAVRRALSEENIAVVRRAQEVVRSEFTAEAMAARWREHLYRLAAHEEMTVIDEPVRV